MQRAVPFAYSVLRRLRCNQQNDVAKVLGPTCTDPANCGVRLA
jgi:hypothetical protein